MELRNDRERSGGHLTKFVLPKRAALIGQVNFQQRTSIPIPHILGDQFVFRKWRSQYALWEAIRASSVSTPKLPAGIGEYSHHVSGLQSSSGFDV